MWCVNSAPYCRFRENISADDDEDVVSCLLLSDATGRSRSHWELGVTDVLSRLRFSDTWRFHHARRESICLSSGEICPVANTAVGIARKAWIKQGPLHASLASQPPNTIIHFYQGFFSQHQLQRCKIDRQGVNREGERKWREREREREEEKKKSPSIKAELQEQIAAPAQLFKGTDDK